MGLPLKLLLVSIAAACLVQELDAIANTGYGRLSITSIVDLLKKGDVKGAVKELVDIPRRSEIVEEIIKKAYRYSAKPSDLTEFAVTIGFIQSEYLASKALLLEMERQNQINENLVLTLYYNIPTDLMHVKYRRVLPVLKRDIIRLRDRFGVYVKAYQISLVAEIEKGNFDRPMDVLEYTKARHNNLEFLSDVYNIYLAKSGAPFKHIYKFTSYLDNYKTKCNASAVMWQRLRVLDKGSGVEALQTWLYAKDTLGAAQFENNTASSWADCKTVADAAAPAYKDRLMQEYVDGLANNQEQIKTWHKEYFGMRMLMMEVIEKMPKEKLQGQNLNTIIDALEKTGILNIRCYAADSMRKKMVEFQMIGSPEHERMLLMVNKTMEDAKYANVYGVARDKCTKAKLL